MDEFEEDGNAFAVPDLWKSSTFPSFPQEASAIQTEGWAPENCEIDLDHDSRSDEIVIFNPSQCFDLSLPDLSSFRYGPLENERTRASSLAEFSDDSTEEARSVEEDPWSIAQISLPDEKTLGLKSWESFQDITFKEPRIIYLSEGGPQALDAALTSHNQSVDSLSYEPSGMIVKSSPMLMVSSTSHNC